MYIKMIYIIYRITVGDYTYIGSTMDFKQRKISHKHNCINTNDTNIKYNAKVYQMIREAGGWDKCEMVPIEEYECDGMIPSRIREEYWRREYNANMNSQKAHTTKEEKKEIKNKTAKEYREINKQKIREKHTCLCGGSYSISSNAVHQRTKKHQDYLANNNISI